MLRSEQGDFPRQGRDGPRNWTVPERQEIPMRRGGSAQRQRKICPRVPGPVAFLSSHQHQPPGGEVIFCSREKRIVSATLVQWSHLPGIDCSSTLPSKLDFHRLTTLFSRARPILHTLVQHSASRLQLPAARSSDSIRVNQCHWDRLFEILTPGPDLTLARAPIVSPPLPTTRSLHLLPSLPYPAPRLPSGPQSSLSSSRHP